MEEDIHINFKSIEKKPNILGLSFLSSAVAVILSFLTIMGIFISWKVFVFLFVITLITVVFLEKIGGEKYFIKKKYKKYKNIKIIGRLWNM